MRAIFAGYDAGTGVLLREGVVTCLQAASPDCGSAPLAPVVQRDLRAMALARLVPVRPCDHRATAVHGAPAVRLAEPAGGDALKGGPGPDLREG
jgi:hypothetical protein